MLERSIYIKVYIQYIDGVEVYTCSVELVSKDRAYSTYMYIHIHIYKFCTLHINVIIYPRGIEVYCRCAHLVHTSILHAPWSYILHISISIKMYATYVCACMLPRRLEARTRGQRHQLIYNINVKVHYNNDEDQRLKRTSCTCTYAHRRLMIMMIMKTRKDEHDESD